MYQFAIQIAGLKKKQTNRIEAIRKPQECVCKVKLNKRIQRVEKKLFIIRESLTQNAKEEVGVNRSKTDCERRNREKKAHREKF